jgi:dihydroflavonol-4-reductase
MKALVTGATGFVGSAVARKLLREDCEVRVLVRRGANLRNVELLDVEIVEGDLTDPASLLEACEGCDAVFHVAADYRLWAKNPSEIYRANCDGTRALLHAARQARVRRIVYTSSVAVLGIPKDGTPGDEETPVTLADMIGHYKRSKFLAEEIVREFVRAGQPIVIVNPSTPIGPRDVKPTPTGRIVLDAAAGRMPAYVDTGLNVAHVDDVAEGHWLAYRKGRIGERYVLGGTDLSLRAILAEIADITGRKAPKIRLPHAAVMPVAVVSELIAKRSGRPPLATVEEIRMSRKKMYFSCAKAKAELGYAPRPARQALQDAITWFRQAGYLPEESESEAVAVT